MNVTTAAASAVQKLQVTGNVTIDVGAVIFMDDTVTWGDQGEVQVNPKNADKYGFVYDTSSKSAPGDVAPGSSGYGSYVETVGITANGSYTKTITGLTANTVYYVRAYAHNDDGYVYGDEIAIQTVGSVVDKFTFKTIDTSFIFKTIDTSFTLKVRRN